ncbi:MAG: hypothetical protein R3240_09280, partial [Gammaproteobacteria bacterium]|nr:hypothetical protein [Gammaproteobacteria bacterium]
MLNWAVIKPISRTLFKEFIATLFILFIISLSVFLLVYYSPNEDMLYEYIVMISEEMQTSIPDDAQALGFLSTFGTWFSAVISGNFGLSLSTGMPALNQSLNFLSNSIVLILYTVALSLLIATPFTYLLVTRAGGLMQKIVSFLFVTTSNFPLFWLAYFVIFLSGKYFGFFPLSDGFNT